MNKHNTSKNPTAKAREKEQMKKKEDIDSIRLRPSRTREGNRLIR